MPITSQPRPEMSSAPAPPEPDTRPSMPTSPLVPPTEAPSVGATLSPAPPAEPTRPPVEMSLRTNFLWTFFGNIIYMGCQGVMLILIAKLLNRESVGLYSLGVAISTPIIIFSQFKLRSVQATDAKHEYRFGHYLSLRLLCTVLAVVIIAAIALSLPLVSRKYPLEVGLVVLAMGLAKAFESMSDIYYGFLQQRERMDRVAQSLMIKGVLSLLAMALGVYLTGSVLWGTIGLACSWLVLLLVYDLRSSRLVLRSLPDDALGLPAPRDRARTLQPCWDAGTLRRLAGLSLPLGLVATLANLNTVIPRYFIVPHFGKDGLAQLGIFAAMVSLLAAGSAVVNALGQSASPRMSRYFATRNRQAFERLLIKLVSVGVLLGVAGILVALFCGKELLTLLYKPEYAAHPTVFVWLMAAGGMNYAYVFFGSAVYAMRKFRVQLPIHAISTVILFLLCLLLVKPYGLQGAAWAVFGSTCFEALAYGTIVLLVVRRSTRALEHPEVAA